MSMVMAYRPFKLGDEGLIGYTRTGEISTYT